MGLPCCYALDEKINRRGGDPEALCLRKEDIHRHWWFKCHVISRRQVQTDEENDNDYSRSSSPMAPPSDDTYPPSPPQPNQLNHTKSPSIIPRSPSLSPVREPAVKLNPKGRPKGSLNKRQQTHENSTRRNPSLEEVMERDSQLQALARKKALDTKKATEKDAKKDAASQKRKDNMAKRKAEQVIISTMRESYENRKAAKAGESLPPTGLDEELIDKEFEAIIELEKAPGKQIQTQASKKGKETPAPKRKKISDKEDDHESDQDDDQVVERLLKIVHEHEARRKADREKARQECMERRAVKARTDVTAIAKVSRTDNPVPANNHAPQQDPIPQQDHIRQRRRQRRRVLSEDPDEFIPELRHFPNNPRSNPPPQRSNNPPNYPHPQTRRRVRPQSTSEIIQEVEDYDPLLDEEYPEWAARENAKDEAEWRRALDEEYEWKQKSFELQQKRQDADQQRLEAVLDKPEQAPTKRKVPVIVHHSPRKQRKVVLPIQEFSSSPNEMQIVLAGRARRQKELDEQTLRAEQSMLDAQLHFDAEADLEDLSEVVVVSSNSDGE
ncbi:MAG: hypothetical protein Q9204_000794 [Flavoplaca sp. TL-2023a]